tara:strand:- start:8563 stop:9219 length:657 start_codon:yes stop_codon:yes gene_type:complete
MAGLHFKKMKDVHIIGTGGLSKELIGYLSDDNKHNLLGCWGEKDFNNPNLSKFYKGNFETFKKSFKKNDIVFIAIAEPLVRKRIYDELKAYELVFDSYIHPSCIISPFAKIGMGCILAPGTMLTGDPKLENFVFTNTEVVIGHDAKVGKYCTFFPKVEICGDCMVGDMCVFGINSIVLPKMNVCNNSKLDAGSILRESIKEPSLYSGNPAKMIKKYKR